MFGASSSVREAGDNTVLCPPSVIVLISGTKTSDRVETSHGSLGTKLHHMTKTDDVIVQCSRSMTSNRLQNTIAISGSEHPIDVNLGMDA